MTTKEKSLYENVQWQVDNDGIDTVESFRIDYFISNDRLLEMSGNPEYKGLYNWPIHMTEKNWVDQQAFLSAFIFGLRYFESKGLFHFDEDILTKTIEAAAIMQVQNYIHGSERARRHSIENTEPKTVCIGELINEVNDVTDVIRQKYPKLAKLFK